MQRQWPKIKQDILDGKYRPSPVRRVEIPKPDGNGVRKLVIPTVMDRIIQQSIYQELVFTFEFTFSDNSYGFRIGRKAQQAVLKSQGYIREVSMVNFLRLAIANTLVAGITAFTFTSAVMALPPGLCS